MTEVLKNKISILSQLANADGNFDIRELTFIYGVCIRNKIEVDSIAEIISQPEPIISLESLTNPDKVSYLTDMFLLMMIDSKVLPKEIEFCLGIGKRLGFDQDGIRSFIDEISGQPDVNEEYLKERVGLLPRIDQQIPD